MQTEYTIQLQQLLAQYEQLGIRETIDYNKFYLYSLITHSTAIEGSTVTEVENQLLFDEGITAHGRSLVEQMMNIDLKAAYEKSMLLARQHTAFSPKMLQELSAAVMQNTGSTYSTLQGEFDSTKGDLRLVNVTAGVGGRSYMHYEKVPKALADFCLNINKQRAKVQASNDIFEQYLLSIDAHFLLVTIHPWVDGNGRMARLVMNMLQFEMGLLPIKVTKEHKAAYIQALVDAREQDSLVPFREFMIEEHLHNLQSEIAAYQQGLEQDVPQNNENVPQNVPQNEWQGAIVEMIRSNPQITRQQMADRLHISTKTIARELKKMPHIHYVGPSKGGHWEVE